MFKWSVLALASIFAGALLWMLNDLRNETRAATRAVNDHLPVILTETKDATRTINRDLPDILARTKQTSEVLATVAADLKQLRDLAGMSDKPIDKTLRGYADAILDLIEKSEGQIGLSKTFSKGIKDPIPAAEWVVGARREALWLALRVRSRAEVAEGLCANYRGAHWYIQVGNSETLALLEWLRRHHPDTDKLFHEKSPTPAGK